ncbi:hypothetical protein STRDD13_00753 [Streptococcus sp. DD13]|nr:hypothetical protein STRDD13_00753 [Streptococcus sp. DD13]
MKPARFFCRKLSSTKRRNIRKLFKNEKLFCDSTEMVYTNEKESDMI